MEGLRSDSTVRGVVFTLKAAGSTLKCLIDEDVLVEVFGAGDRELISACLSHSRQIEDWATLLHSAYGSTGVAITFSSLATVGVSPPRRFAR